MSETNTIRPFAIHDASHMRRRSQSVASTQSSFEEELLKLQFFDTQVEASPILPVEPTTKNEKTKEPEPESEVDDSKDTTESNERSEEYAYGVVTPQLPIATDTSLESHPANDADVKGALDVDVDGVDMEPSAEARNVIAVDQSSLQNSVVENSEPANIDLEGVNLVQTVSSDNPENPTNDKGQVKPNDVPVTTPVESQTQPLQVESDSRSKEPRAVGSKKQTKDSKPEVETEFALPKKEQDNRDEPVLDANNSESRSLAEAAAFESSQNDTPESKPQENRRSERLERNRLDSGTSFDGNDREPTVDVSLGNQADLEASIEPVETFSVPPEQTTLGSVESVSNAVVVSAPQPNLAVTPSPLSLAGGIVPNATLTSNPSTPPSTGAVSVTNNISGSTSTAASKETTGSSRANLTPYQESKLVQRVLRGIEQLGNGGGQVRIRLHPPELGTLQMTLKFEATQVTAQFEVENRVARDALLGNAQVLKDRLKEQGLEVQKFEVEIRSDVNDSLNSSTGDRQGQGSSSNGRNYESRFAVSNNNRINPDSRPEPTNAAMPWVRTKGSLDVSA
jgi:flagellar hook-length control protein FliK